MTATGPAYTVKVGRDESGGTTVDVAYARDPADGAAVAALAEERALYALWLGGKLEEIWGDGAKTWNGLPLAQVYQSLDRYYTRIQVHAIYTAAGAGADRRLYELVRDAEPWVACVVRSFDERRGEFDPETREWLEEKVTKIRS